VTGLTATTPGGLSVDLAWTLHDDATGAKVCFVARELGDPYPPNTPPAKSCSGTIYSGSSAHVPVSSHTADYYFFVFARDPSGNLAATAPYTDSTTVSSFVVTGMGSITAGTVQNNVAVTAVGGVSNAQITNFVGTVHFATTDTNTAERVIPADYTFVAGDSGHHTFPGVKLVTEGGQSLTVSVLGNSAVAGSGFSNVAAGTRLLRVFPPATATHGVAFTVYVCWCDTYKNSASFPGQSGRTLSVSDGNTTPTSPNFSGPATAQFTEGAPGHVQISAWLNDPPSFTTSAAVDLAVS
jgi:hypothetical protein